VRSDRRDFRAWPSYRVEQEHSFGRFISTANGNRLSAIARRLAKGKHPGRVDEASLPDWLMRRLFIPAAARKAIRPHELRRRRMARIYGRYLAVLEPLLSAGPKSIKKAEELLRRAGREGGRAGRAGRPSGGPPAAAGEAGGRVPAGMRRAPRISFAGEDRVAMSSPEVGRDFGGRTTYSKPFSICSITKAHQ